MVDDAQRWHRVKQVFQDALERPADERERFVRSACGDDRELQGEVASLLLAHAAAGNFAQGPAIAGFTPSVGGALLNEAWAEPGRQPLGEHARLAPGQTFGSYRVEGLLGAGGMGEVYRARDTRLGRDVAIKILPRAFKDDPDRLARFEREARVLASLNHPHIGVIYGLEESDGLRALVMEVVEGEDLAQRIARGPIALQEALPLATQIAEALEAAHEQGIIHRDLKPANIRIRPDGVVKVLDFGLAKAVNGGAPGPDQSQMPSATVGPTRDGVVVGTAAYMSPEQARGQTVDKRTDIWAFGCVLFEMLTGTRAFESGNVTDTIVAVVSREPDWSTLPAVTPTAVRRLLRRALTKDPRHRLSDASMARLEIKDASTMPEDEAPGAAAITGKGARPRERAAWMLVAASVLTVAALLFPAARYLRGPASGEPVRFLIDVPPMPDANQVTISPDGRTVAYVARADDGRIMLHVRPIDSVNARPLAGTENASNAFWSPDSRHIGFESGASPNYTLKRVDASGGPPQSLARCGSGTWNRDDVIICSDGGALSRVSASGGGLTRITTLDTSLQEIAHVWPHFLPDGRHFLYLAWSTNPENRAIYIGALDSDLKTRLMTAQSKAVYAPPGFLLFHRQGTLFAQAFDATRLTLQGDPVRLAERTTYGTGFGNGAFAVSSTGTLVYRSDSSARIGQLAWFDWQGRRLENLGLSGRVNGFTLSPDEKRVAFTRGEPGEPGQDIWTLEISTGVTSPLTTNPATESEPVWSPNSQTVLFASNQTGKGYVAVFQRALGDREDVPVFESTEGSQWPDDVSRDGRFILINDRNRGIVARPTTGDGKPIPLLRSDAWIDEAHFSPNGRWVAYASTESGSAEIYVASFPGFKYIKPVSAGGGNEPQWRRDGKELFYRTTDGQLMAVGVSVTGSMLDTTAPKKLFSTGVRSGTPTVNRYAVSGDGSRFLILASDQDNQPTPITVILNWTSTLK